MAKNKFSDRSVAKAATACYLFFAVTLAIDLIYIVWSSIAGIPYLALTQEYLLWTALYGVGQVFLFYFCFRFFQMGQMLAMKPAMIFAAALALEQIPLLLLPLFTPGTMLYPGVITFSQGLAPIILILVPFLMIFLPWLLLAFLAVGYFYTTVYLLREETGRNEFPYAYYLFVTGIFVCPLLAIGALSLLIPASFVAFGLGLSRAYKAAQARSEKS